MDQGLSPRVRGNLLDPQPEVRFVGLSPRVRGNLERVLHDRRRERSIPACTGEPDRHLEPGRMDQVYPRVYGGTRWAAWSGPSTRGLSPRVRGNLPAVQEDDEGPGSIPACTGEPRGSPSSPGQCPVYPRVYGGTGYELGFSGSGEGLSPRVRGNRTGVANITRTGRSIPACTGEPRLPEARSRRGMVYPRVYGGTRSRLALRQHRLGLSPRVRGNRDGCSVRLHFRWSIPACTGEPDAVSDGDLFRGVYPRVYGGTLSSDTAGGTPTGLSPRVRGNPCRSPCTRHRPRSIPACTGEPRRGG